LGRSDLWDSATASKCGVDPKYPGALALALWSQANGLLVISENVSFGDLVSGATWLDTIEKSLGIIVEALFQ
jgi:hypothetical protein